jgi:hypothetical protein
MPWLGYFDRIAKSDLHIVLDHVQFEKNSITNRNKLRTANKWCWITVPVSTKNMFGGLPIRELKIDNSSKWGKKHWGTMIASYSRAPYFGKHYSFFQSLYMQDWPLLSPLLEESTQYFLKELGISTRIVRSSDLSPTKSKGDLILELCKKVGATTYISGPFGRAYLNQGAFDDARIKLQFHDYKHPIYSQSFDGFEPFMSIVDLLFNHGSNSLEILRL